MLVNTNENGEGSVRLKEAVKKAQSFRGIMSELESIYG